MVSLDQNEIKKKIVVIDDDAITRKLLMHGLKNDYEVYIISNATEAITICEREKPDLILLDLVMPNIDGYEMLQLIKNHSVLCDIPVVCMSATQSTETSGLVRDLGAAGFIHKPINVKFLERDITAIIKATNDVLISKNGRVDFQVLFNSTEKQKIIFNKILELLEKNEKVVLLSWRRGDDFFDEFSSLQESLDSDDLIYIEVKSTVMAKFQFLQDLSPLIFELESFVEGNSRSYNLIFDEPKDIFNFSNQQKSFAQASQLSQLLNTSFKAISYICQRPREDNEISALKRIGKIFTDLRG